VDVPEPPSGVRWQDIAFGKPVILTLIVSALLGAFPFVEPVANVMLMAMTLGIGVLGGLILAKRRAGEPAWHGLIEGRAAWFTVFTVIAVLIGGVAEIVPSVIAGNETLARTTNVPYRALE